MSTPSQTPCVFCGSTDLQHIAILGRRGYATECSHCGARGPRFGSPDEALEGWRRIAEPFAAIQKLQIDQDPETKTTVWQIIGYIVAFAAAIVFVFSSSSKAPGMGVWQAGSFVVMILSLISAAKPERSNWT